MTWKNRLSSGGGILASVTVRRFFGVRKKYSYGLEYRHTVSLTYHARWSWVPGYHRPVFMIHMIIKAPHINGIPMISRLVLFPYYQPVRIKPPPSTLPRSQKYGEHFQKIRPHQNFGAKRPKNSHLARSARKFAVFQVNRARSARKFWVIYTPDPDCLSSPKK